MSGMGNLGDGNERRAERQGELRSGPRGVLKGAQTVLSCLFACSDMLLQN